MAPRTTGTVSLYDMIQRGTLSPDEEIHIRRRSAPAVKGTVLADGRIRVGDEVHDTPSGAAKAGLGRAPVQGWGCWRVPRLGDKTLGELREDVQ